MDHEIIRQERNIYGKCEKEAEQSREGGTEIIGSVETPGGESGARSAERSGIQIVRRHTASEQHADESPPTQKARIG